MNFNNQILIALPDMLDERFKNAVILICEHNENGAMGLVLNHPLNINTQQIFEDLELQKPLMNHVVSEGGPINKNCGFVLHNNNQTFSSTIKIKNNLSLTTSKDLLKLIAEQQFNSSWQFILGYSGWSKGQLESEIAENTWLTCPADLNLIFNTEKEQQWESALALIGVKNYQNISGIGHA
ncbi:MAG: YqgE/AlgH family protein [Marinicellaceae bacterium]